MYLVKRLATFGGGVPTGVSAAFAFEVAGVEEAVAAVSVEDEVEDADASIDDLLLFGFFRFTSGLTDILAS